MHTKNTHAHNSLYGMETGWYVGKEKEKQIDAIFK